MTQKTTTWILIVLLIEGPLYPPTAQAAASAPTLLEASDAASVTEGVAGGSSSLQLSVGATGNLNLSFPLNAFFPRGRISSGPSLSLSYDSNSRLSEGPMGMGWGLNISTITRTSCSEIIPNPDYDDYDCFASDLGKLVPISDPKQAVVQYRLQGGPYTQHFSFDRSSNCWAQNDLVNAQQSLFCQTEQGPTDCRSELPLEQAPSGQDCSGLEDHLAQLLCKFDPTESLELDPLIDSNAPLSTEVDETGIRTPDFSDDFSKQIKETIGEAGISPEDLRDSIIFDPGEQGGSGPTVPEGTRSQSMTLTSGSSLSYSSSSASFSPSPYARANQTQRWWLSSIKDPFGNLIQHYYDSCPNPAQFRLFHWNGVCWDAWDDSDADSDPDSGPQFCARALYSEREDYAPVHGNIYSPEILSGIEIRPVVDFVNDYPVLDENTLNAKVNLVYEQDTSESQIRFGAPTLKEIQVEDGEGKSLSAPTQFEYNNPIITQSSVKAFCDEYDYYPFYKPKDAEWITSRNHNIPWTRVGWLSPEESGTTEIPYMMREFVPKHLQYSRQLESGSEAYAGLTEIGSLTNDTDGADFYTLSFPIQGSEGDSGRPDYIFNEDYEFGCFHSEDMPSAEILPWQALFSYSGFTDHEFEDLYDHCYDNDSTPYTIGATDSGDILRVEDEFYYDGRYYPVLSEVNVHWNPSTLRDGITSYIGDSRERDFGQAFFNLPPEQCPQEYAEQLPNYDEAFGGCFVFGPYLENGESSYSRIQETTDQLQRWVDLDSDGLADVVKKDKDWCSLAFDSNGIGNLASDGSTRDPLSEMALASVERNCSAEEIEQRYESSWLDQLDPDSADCKYGVHPINDNEIIITDPRDCPRFSYLPTNAYLGDRGTEEDGKYPHWQKSDLMDCDGDGDTDWVTVGDGEILCWWNNSERVKEIASNEGRVYNPQEVSFCKVPRYSDGTYPRGSEEDQENLKCPVPLHRFDEDGVLSKNDERESRIDFIDFTADWTGSDWVYVDTNKPYWNLLRFDGGLKEVDLEGNPFSRYGFGSFDEKSSRVYVPPRSERTYRTLSEWEDDGKGEGIVHFGGNSWAVQNGITSPPHWMYCDTWKGERSGDSPGDSYVWTCYPFKEGEILDETTGDVVDYVSSFSPKQIYKVKAPIPGPTIQKEGFLRAAMIDMNADGILDIADLSQGAWIVWIDPADPLSAVAGWRVYHGCVDDGSDSTTSCEHCPENRPFDPGSLPNPSFKGGLITHVSYGMGREKEISWASAEEFKFDESTGGDVDNPLSPHIPMVTSIEETESNDPDLQPFITDDGTLRRAFNYEGCFADPITGQFMGCPLVTETLSSASAPVSISTYYLMDFPSPWNLHVGDVSTLNPVNADPSLWPSDSTRAERVLRSVPWAKEISYSKTTVDSSHYPYYRIETRTDLSVSSFPSSLPVVSEDSHYTAVLGLPTAQLQIHYVSTTGSEDNVTSESRAYKKITYQDPDSVSVDQYVGYVESVDDFGFSSVDGADSHYSQLRYREITSYNTFFSAPVPRIAPKKQCRVEVDSSLDCDPQTGQCTGSAIPATSCTTEDSLYRDFSYDPNGLLLSQRSIIQDPYGNETQLIVAFTDESGGLSYDDYGHATRARSTLYLNGEELRFQEKEFLHSNEGGIVGPDDGRFLTQEITRGTGVNPLVRYLSWDRNTGRPSGATRSFLLDSSSDPGSFSSCSGSCLEGAVLHSYDSLGRLIQKHHILPEGHLSDCYYYSEYNERSPEPWIWTAAVTRNSSSCWSSLPSESTLKLYPYQKTVQNSLGVLQTERSSNGEEILLQKLLYDKDGVAVQQSQWDSKSSWNPKWFSQEHDPLGRIIEQTFTTGASIQTRGGAIDVSWMDPNWVEGSAQGHRRTLIGGPHGEISQTSLEMGVQDSGASLLTVNYGYGLTGDAGAISFVPTHPGILGDTGDPNPLAVNIERDSYGRPTQWGRPDTGLHRVVYDAEGALLIDQFLSEGEQVMRTQFAYHDGLGRPTTLYAVDSSVWNKPLESNQISEFPNWDNLRPGAPYIQTSFEYDSIPEGLSSDSCVNDGMISKKTHTESLDAGSFTEAQEFCWDGAGRLKTQRTIHKQNSLETSYETSLSYDSYGRVTQRFDAYCKDYQAERTPSCSDEDQSALNTLYRWNGNLPQLVSDASRGAAIESSGGKIIAKSFHYNEKGMLQGVVLGNATVLNYLYDGEDQLGAIRGCQESVSSNGTCNPFTSSGLLFYQEIEKRDPAGDILEVRETATALRDSEALYQFSYDGLHQLTGETLLLDNQEIYSNLFRYDAYGNRAIAERDAINCGSRSLCWDDDVSGGRCRDQVNGEFVTSDCCGPEDNRGPECDYAAFSDGGTNTSGTGGAVPILTTAGSQIPTIDPHVPTDIDVDDNNTCPLWFGDQQYFYNDTHHRLDSIQVTSGDPTCPSTTFDHCFSWNSDGTLQKDWTPSTGYDCSSSLSSTSQWTHGRKFSWNPAGKLLTSEVLDQGVETDSTTYFYNADGLKARKMETASTTDFFGASLTVVNGIPTRYFTVPGSGTLIAALTDPDISLNAGPIYGPAVCGMFSSADPSSQNPWGFLMVLIYLSLLLALWRWRLTCKPGVFEAIALSVAVIFLFQTAAWAPAQAAPRSVPPGRWIKDVEIADREVDPIIDNFDDMFGEDDSTPCTPDADSPLRFFANDLRGNLAVVTDSTGCPIETHAYTAFGEDACDIFPALCLKPLGAEPVASSTDPNFAGKTKEKAAGLIATDARYYDPTFGLFISPDSQSDEIYVSAHGGSPQDQLYKTPIRFHPYAYAGNNPITRSDPSGELFGIDDGIWAFIIIPLLAGAAAFAYAEIAGDGDGWREFTHAVLTAVIFAGLMTIGAFAVGTDPVSGTLWSMEANKIAHGVAGTATNKGNLRDAKFWEEPWRRVRDSYSNPFTMFFDALGVATELPGFLPASIQTQAVVNGTFSLQGFAWELGVQTAEMGAELSYSYSLYQSQPFRFGFKVGESIFASYYFFANSVVTRLVGLRLNRKLNYYDRLEGVSKDFRPYFEDYLASMGEPRYISKYGPKTKLFLDRSFGGSPQRRRYEGLFEYQAPPEIVNPP